MEQNPSQVESVKVVNSISEAIKARMAKSYFGGLVVKDVLQEKKVPPNEH